MWTRIVSLAAIAAFTLPGEAAFAQQPGSSRCSHAAAGTVWAQVDWLRLQTSGGRIALSSTRCGQARVVVEPTADNPLRQTLSVDSQPGTFLVSYEAADEHSTITLDLDERQQVTVRQRPTAADAAELRYFQPVTGPVQLTIGADQRQTYAAASLWHLLLSEPAASEHLVPVLDRIRPNWRLAEQVAAARAALAASAETVVCAQRRQWQDWVEQLSDPSYARRSEADRALRAAGQSVLAHLRRLDPATLDLEQRRRIRAILTAIADSGPDSPERIAAWLADDKQVWLALMRHGDASEQQAAARHLSKICGKPVAIDPAASDDQREQQMIELKALLAEN
ncbi:MAG: hypothetical protein L0211_14035 [Planctomycetaceae bacterium]|nr:hypothetical protein [Planctomycetaceae bacterium]